MPHNESGDYIPYSLGLLSAERKANQAAALVNSLLHSSHSTKAQIVDAEDALEQASNEFERLSEEEHTRLKALKVKTTICI